MGSDESHFNVSLVVRDKVTRQCPQTTYMYNYKVPGTYTDAFWVTKIVSHGYIEKVIDAHIKA